MGVCGKEGALVKGAGCHEQRAEWGAAAITGVQHWLVGTLAWPDNSKCTSRQEALVADGSCKAVRAQHPKAACTLSEATRLHQNATRVFSGTVFSLTARIISGTASSCACHPTDSPRTWTRLLNVYIEITRYTIDASCRAGPHWSEQNVWTEQPVGIEQSRRSRPPGHTVLSVQ